MNTKQELEKISEQCLSELTVYKYNKGLNISDKFRKGKVTALSYVLELIYHFFQRDKLLKQEFNNILSSQIKEAQDLKDGDYKQGLDDALNWVAKLSSLQK
ncbi:MAG: hypothetical protein RBT59_13225 [Arcobacteraceae bacterium]|jgi:hypothetical protein|nr:hypothetical protein [Arcobacteraceae bacterium]